MYAVTGATGKVGGAVARTLLMAGAPVRVVVRDSGKGNAWRERGCEVVSADLLDSAALEQAFRGVASVFVMMPSSFDPAPDFAEARTMIEALRSDLERARPPKIVVLSTIGAEAVQPNLLNRLGILERAMGSLAIPATFLRPANGSWKMRPGICLRRKRRA
jgi:NAD(P)H dehydrogenase (quinone)